MSDIERNLNFAYLYKECRSSAASSNPFCTLVFNLPYVHNIQWKIPLETAKNCRFYLYFDIMSHGESVDVH